MRAVIYARVSRDDTGEGRSVERQVEACQKLADLRGWDVVAIEQDISISAWSGVGRPAWNNVLDLIDRGQVDVLVAWHIDRMTRSMLDLEGLILLATDRGVGVATASGDIDLTTDVGRMVARILAAVARAEVERKSARQRLANEQRAREGKPWLSGTRPFGYSKDGYGIVEEEAAALRMAAAQVLMGVPLARIASTWAGPKTAPGVRATLLNPRYAGVRTYRGAEVAQGDWPAIFDLETHVDLVAKLTADDRRKGSVRAGPAPTTLLTGIAECDVCGEPVRATSNGARNPRYACRAGCILVPRHEVDEYVTGIVVGLLSISDIVERLASQGDDSAEGTMAERKAVLERIDKAEDLLLDGKITHDDYARLVSKAHGRIAELDAGRQDRTSRSQLGRFLGVADMRAAWDAALLEERRELVRRLVAVRLGPVGRGKRSGYNLETGVRWTPLVTVETKHGEPAHTGTPGQPRPEELA